MDKEYQGASQFTRKTSPKRKPIRCVLSSEERRNKNISSDLIIEEKFFGRLRTLCNAFDSMLK